MTNNIATLCATFAQYQGRDIMLYAHTTVFCDDRKRCKRPFRTGIEQSCHGHPEEESARRVRLNFCDLRTDRLVVKYSPWRFEYGKRASLEKQRELHIMESNVRAATCDMSYTVVYFRSGRVKQLDIILCDWWR